MARRFKIGEAPVYDRLYDHLKLHSNILNAEKKTTGVNWTALGLSDATSLRGMLKNYEGDHEDGKIKTGRGERQPAKIKRMEIEVEAVEAEFEKEKQAAINSGKAAPEKMSKTTLEKYHQALARLDITREERDKIKKKLAEFEKQEQEEEDRKLLAHGPVGAAWGDPLRTIDNQNVGTDDDGELVIADSRSPYDGMKVREYREKVVMPFLKNRSRKHRKIKWQNLPPRPQA